MDEPPEDGSGAEESGTRTLSGLTSVEVDPDTILQTVLCMRPYRPAGFRLETEQVGDKLLIHNYGHGGGGFTLSWGTASLALDLLQQSGRERPTRVAVVGCGVIGLSTALLLRRRGMDSVEIANRLLDEHRILVGGLSENSWSGAPLVRVTPNVFTAAEEIDAFVEAVEGVAGV